MCEVETTTAHVGSAKLASVLSNHRPAVTHSCITSLMDPERLRTMIPEVARKFSKHFQTMTTVGVTGPPPPWHAAYPAPRNTAVTIRREVVLDMIKQSAETSSRNYILIDLRRNDHEVHKIGRHLTLRMSLINVRAAPSVIRSTFLRRACTLLYRLCTSSLRTQVSAK